MKFYDAETVSETTRRCATKG